MTPEHDLRGRPTGQLPMALARVHRSDVAGEPVRLWVDDGDDVDDLLEGAGFVDVRRHDDGSIQSTRARTLPYTVGDGMRLLVCGLNPSLHAADAGVGFVTPSNRFWPAALEAGLVTTDRDALAAFEDHAVEMTDLVKRATRRADELRRGEYRRGLARVERLCRRHAPGAVCFVGLAGWRVAVDRHAAPGIQERQLGGCPVYVMPSTSGLNARTSLDQHVGHLRAAAALATTTP